MASSRAWVLVAVMVSTACGTTAVSPTALEREREPPLSCAGQERSESTPIPELGELPGGGFVTSGLTLICSDNSLEVRQWGPDSSSIVDVPRERAMQVWGAWSSGSTSDERWLAINEALSHP